MMTIRHPGGKRWARWRAHKSHGGGLMMCPYWQIQTIDDHIRRKRLMLRHTQEQVAERLGVTTASVYNWESDDSQPSVPYIPAIIDFLGYNPLPAATTLAGRLVRHRTSLGLTQSESARRVGVDPGTLARWHGGSAANENQSASTRRC
jgi:transcriptional regulator with XRE-family HTH domain